MSRFLSRKGAFRKFRKIWATSLSRKEQYPPERTTGTVQGGFFCPVKPIHPSVPRNFGRSGRLAYPEQKNVLWTYCYVQSRGHFSTRNNPFIPACREIRIGPVRVSHILFRDKNLPERTVCVQSRGHFSIRDNPSIPARSLLADGGK